MDGDHATGRIGIYGDVVHHVVSLSSLQFELMIESVLVARDKWLKPVSIVSLIPRLSSGEEA